MTQCRLGSGSAELVAWIDSEAAILSKRMTLDDDVILFFKVILVGDTISRQALQKHGAVVGTPATLRAPTIVVVTTRPSILFDMMACVAVIWR